MTYQTCKRCAGDSPGTKASRFTMVRPCHLRHRTRAVAAAQSAQVRTDRHSAGGNQRQGARARWRGLTTRNDDLAINYRAAVILSARIAWTRELS